MKIIGQLENEQEQNNIKENKKEEVKVLNIKINTRSRGRN